MPTVADGDCIVSIADQLGFRDYHSVWDYAPNAALKQATNRPNPNQLAINDNVQVPADKTKSFMKAVDQTWIFAVKARKLPKLRIIILGGRGSPLAGKKWKLTGAATASGTTKDDGLIDISDLDPQVKDGTLTVEWHKSKRSATKKPKPAKIDRPTYPRPIDATEFEDDAPVLPDKADDTIVWTLKIGSSQSFNVLAGLQGRLHNLGSRCDTSSDATATAKCVKAYQRSKLDDTNPNGTWSDIQGDLRNRHDNP